MTWDPLPTPMVLQCYSQGLHRSTNLTIGVVGFSQDIDDAVPDLVGFHDSLLLHLSELFQHLAMQGLVRVPQHSDGEDEAADNSSKHYCYEALALQYLGEKGPHPVRILRMSWTRKTP